MSDAALQQSLGLWARTTALVRPSLQRAWETLATIATGQNTELHKAARNLRQNIAPILTANSRSKMAIYSNLTGKDFHILVTPIRSSHDALLGAHNVRERLAVRIKHADGRMEYTLGIVSPDPNYVEEDQWQKVGTTHKTGRRLFWRDLPQETTGPIATKTTSLEEITDSFGKVVAQYAENTAKAAAEIAEGARASEFDLRELVNARVQAEAAHVFTTVKGSMPTPNLR